MKTLLIFASIFLLSISLQGQAVGINTDTPHSSAILDITSSDKGILIPRMKKVYREGIPSPATGLLVYEYESQSFWYYSDAGWVELQSDKIFENELGVVRNTGDHDTNDFLFGSEKLPGQFPISDSLFFFDKSKAAFRAGRLGSSDRWAPENIGFGSVALGYNNKASGSYSTALGLESVAEGNYSFTAGTLNKATGTASMAIGFVTEANGYTSFSAGFETRADSYMGTALGQFNIGGGDPSSWVGSDPIFEIGIGTNASERTNGMTLLKNGDFILGHENIPPGQEQIDTSILYFDRSLGAFRAGILTASPNWSSSNVGKGSFAGGLNTIASGNYSSAFGFASTASGEYSFAVGRANIASGKRAISIGNFNTSTGFASIAMGDINNSSGFASFATGRETEASASYAFSAGNLTIAEGAASTALGSQSHATATASIATGLQTQSTGLASTSMGLGTQANSYTSLAIGRYNTGGGSGSAWNSEDPLFEVGIGSSDVIRENAFTILKDGSISFLNYSFPISEGAKDQVLQTNADGVLSWTDMDSGVFQNFGNLTKPKPNYTDNDLVVGHSKLPSGIASEKLLFFDESLAAFRVGELESSDAWSSSDLGVNSFATGRNTRATNNYSVAMGFATHSSGVASFAMGYDVSAKGAYSTSLGTLNTALGTASFAAGNETTASGLRATSFGNQSLASGENSFSIGLTGTASGKNAFNSGWNNNSLGDNSATFGQGSSASGIASVAMGLSNQVIANISTAIGESLITNSYACVALGRYNMGLGQWPNVWLDNNQEPILEVGIGSIVTRRNAMTIMKDGSVGIGTDAPTATLDVDHNDNANPFFLPFVVRNSGATALYVDNGGNTRVANNLFISGRIDMWPSTNYAVQYKLELPNIATIEDGVGNAYSWHTYSDARIKKNVVDLPYGLKDLMNLRPVKYHHHSTDYSEKGFELRDDYGIDIGFIAQEVHEIIEEVVHKPEDESQQLWTMNYSKITPVLVKAIQEQQEIILLLKAELALKGEELKEIKGSVDAIMRKLDTIASTDH